MIYKILLPILLVALLTVIWIGVGKDLFKIKVNNTSDEKVIATVIPSQIPSIIPIGTNIGATETREIVEVDKITLPPGWQTYTNSQYGFTISHPSDYKVLTDKDSLYGWPNAVVLLYAGGQSYDVAIEVWDKEEEYKEKYPGQTLPAYKIDGKIITISDQTKNAETSQIVESFIAGN